MILTIRLNDQASRHMRRFGQEVKGLAKLQQTAVRVAAAEERQARAAATLAERTRAIENLRGVEAAKLIQARNTLTRTGNRIETERQSLYNREGKILGQIQDRENSISKVARDRLKTQGDINRLQTRVAAQRVKVAEAEPLAQTKARADILRKAQAQADKAIANTISSMGATAKLEKSGLEIAEDRVALEKQLRSERAKLGAATKAVRAAERSKIDPTTTGAVAAQQAAKQAVAQTRSQLEGLTGAHTRLAIQAELYGKKVGDAAVEAGRLRAQMLAVPTTAGVGDREALTRTLADQEARLKTLQGTLSSYDTDVATHNRRIRELRADQLAAVQAMGQIPARIDENKQAFRTLDEQVLKHNRALETAADRHATAQRAFARSSAELATLRTELAGLRWDALDRGSAAASHLGRSMALAGGVTVGALALMANSAAELNKTATLAATQMSDTGVEAAKNGKLIESAILDVMQDSTSSAQDLSAAMYNIFSSTNVKSIGDGTKFLKSMSDAAMAGQANVTDTTNLAIQVMNTYGLTTDELAGKMDHIFATIRLARISLEDYTKSLSQVLPASNDAGQSMEDMNAAFLTTTRFLDVSFARTGLARLYELITRPEAVEGLRQLGVEALGADKKLRPMHEVMLEIAKAAPEMVQGQKTAQEFFRDITKAGGAPVGQAGTIQAARVFSTLVKHAEEYATLHKELIALQNQYQEQLLAMEMTTGIQWEKFKIQMQALALELGSAAIPALMTLGGILGDAAHWFNGLSDGTKKAIVLFVAFGGIATLLAGSVLAVVAVFTRFAILLRGLKGSAPIFGMFKKGGDDMAKAGGDAKIMGGAMQTLGSQVGEVSTRLALMGGGLTALLIGIPLLTGHIDVLTDAIGGFDGALMALNIIVILTTLRKLAPFILLIAGRFAILRGAIFAMGLASTGSIVAIGLLSVALSVLIRKIPYWDKAFKGLGGAIYDATHQDAAPMADNFRAHVDSMINLYEKFANNPRFKNAAGQPTGIRVKLEQMFPGMAEEDFERVFAIAEKHYKTHRAAFLQAIHDPPARPGTGVAAQQALANELVGGKYTDAAFKKHTKLVQNMRKALEKAPTFQGWVQYYNALKDLQNKSTEAQRQAMEMMPQMTDAAVLKAVQKLEQMRLAAERAPSMAKWQAYYAAQAALQDKATEGQLKAAEAMAEAAGPSMNSNAVLAAAQNIERLKAVAESAPTMANWEAYYAAQEALSKQASNAQIQSAQAVIDAMEAPTISNAALTAMIQQAENMRRQLEVAPSPQGWISYYALLDQISKQSTDTQRQAIESYVQAQNALVDKAKDKLKELSSALVSMYQEIRSENQNLFGSLLAGPNIDRLNDQVDKIREAAKNKTDALRDQIDTLRDVGDDIDSATGNLIDWGLLPKPSDNKAAIKTIENQIEQINDAADKAADKLAKRIAEKKFTPKEIQRDLQMQMNQFLQFSKTLDALRKRGAPIELVEQLKALGPEALPAIKAIQKMNPKQWEQYIGTFKKAQKLIDQQSAKDLKSELKKYQTRGKLIADAIITGVTSQDAKLQASIERLIVKMFPELAGKLKAAKDAEAKTKGTTTKPPGKGKPPARKPAPAPVKPKKPTATTATHVTFNYHYHNEGGKGMGADTWFRRQSFRDRTRTKVC